MIVNRKVPIKCPDNFSLLHMSDGELELQGLISGLILVHHTVLLAGQLPIPDMHIHILYILVTDKFTTVHQMVIQPFSGI